MNSLCWEEIKVQMAQETHKTWGAHLRKSLVELDFQPVWESMVEKTKFNKVSNESAKKKCLYEDKKTLYKRRHAWTVINYYTHTKPQAYLAAHFSIEIKKELHSLPFRNARLEGSTAIMEM